MPSVLITRTAILDLLKDNETAYISADIKEAIESNLIALAEELDIVIEPEDYK